MNIDLILIVVVIVLLVWLVVIKWWTAPAASRRLGQSCFGGWVKNTLWPITEPWSATRGTVAC